MSHNIKARLFTEDKSQVCHMHTDPSCNHTAIGTRRTITLWDLEQGCRVEGSEVIHCYSNMLVYVEPNAFVLNGNDGVEVWNLKTGEHVKHVNIDMRFYSIGTNRDQIIMSTGYKRYLRNTVNFSNSCVVIFSTSELADPKVPAKEVRWREFLRNEQVGLVRVDAAIHRTGFVAVYPKVVQQTIERGHLWRRHNSTECPGLLMVKHFDFWSADQTVGGERNSLAKIEHERLRNSRRRESTRRQKLVKKNQNIKHVI